MLSRSKAQTINLARTTNFSALKREACPLAQMQLIHTGKVKATLCHNPMIFDATRKSLVENEKIMVTYRVVNASGEWFYTTTLAKYNEEKRFFATWLPNCTIELVCMQ